ncbi:helix-turn-helix transcriptional regulator [Falsihalocynthiibacter sp. CO-5D18]|uniref:helix-turn-helix transcriptional regulator n=1 Tax=Falsihalocynthiibacter sp. CO-5D18 TaxID=3240872 RepID=UPI00350F5C84
MLQKHYRRKEVEVITGLSRTTIYAMMDEGTFPRPIRMGKKAVAWPESVLSEWLKSRAQTVAQ